MIEWLVKTLISALLFIAVGLTTALALMIILNGFFPLLSFWEWFAWAAAGIIVVNAGYVTARFREELDKRS